MPARYSGRLSAFWNAIDDPARQGWPFSPALNIPVAGNFPCWPPANPAIDDDAVRLSANFPESRRIQGRRSSGWRDFDRAPVKTR